MGLTPMLNPVRPGGSGGGGDTALLHGRVARLEARVHALEGRVGHLVHTEARVKALEDRVIYLSNIVANLQAQSHAQTPRPRHEERPGPDRWVDKAGGV